MEQKEKDKIIKEIAKELFKVNTGETVTEGDYWEKHYAEYFEMARTTLPFIEAEVQKDIFRAIAQFNIECGTYEELSLKLTSYMIEHIGLSPEKRKDIFDKEYSDRVCPE